MVSKIAVMNNPTGLHARPAAQLISFVKQFDCTVFLQIGSKKANAASIINLLTLGAVQGSEIEVICTGADEADAAPKIVEFIENIMD